MSTIFRDVVTINGFVFNGNFYQSFDYDMDGEIDETVYVPPNVMYYCDLLDGWNSSAEPQVSVAAMGQSDGVVPNRRFPYKEKYVEVGGYVLCSTRAEAETAKEILLELFDSNDDLWVFRQPADADGRRMLMRAVSSLEFPEDLAEQGFRWIVRLMAPWPFKLGTLDRSVLVRPYEPLDYFRLYPRTYSLVNGVYGRSYLTNDTDVALEPVIEKVNTLDNPQAKTTTLSWAAAGLGSSTLSIVSSRMRLTAGATTGSRVLVMVGLQDHLGNFLPHPTYYPSISPGEKVSFRCIVRGHATKTLVVKLELNLYLNINETFISVEPDPSNPDSEIKKTVTIPPATDVLVEWAGVAEVPFLPAAPDTPRDFSHYRFSLWPYASNGTSSMANGDYLDFTEFAWIRGFDDLPVEYFHGDTPDSSDGRTTYSWAGPTNASQSQKTKLVESQSSVRVLDIAIVPNNGSAISYPVLKVTGPLVAGNWYIVNETTGERISVPQEVPEGVTLVFDSLEKTAYLGAEEVSYFVRGTWPYLAPRSNTAYRLVTATPSPNARLEVLSNDVWR